MPGWDDDRDDADEDPVRIDGGTEDDAAKIQQLLEGDDASLADAERTSEDDEEFESGPAMDFGLKIGAPFALVAVGLLFVGPTPLLEFDPGGMYIIDTLDVGGPGNIVYISAATLVLSLFAGLVYPFTAEDLDEDFKMDIGLGISLPTIALVGALVLLFLLWPVLYSLLNGALIQAGIALVVAVVIVGIAVAGSIITLVLAAIATLYFVGPALLGSYVGGFVGQFAAT
jgi:hypothetical protein